MATATTSEQPDLGKRTQQPVRALAPAPDGSGGGMLAVAGGAAGVLLMGTLAGLAWRRRTTGS
jgi:predicted lipid-binding transport protein (Tim44 family)